jgi:hypothetical protein
MAGNGKMEKNKRIQAFGNIIEAFIDCMIAIGVAEDEAEAYNMFTDYVGKKMVEQ